MQTEPLTIQYPDGKSIALLPVPRSRLLELREQFVALQAIWLSNAFGTGETVADERGWGLMQAIAALLPHQDNPAVTGFDLEPLSNDYQQLETLFFAVYVDFSREQTHGWRVAIANIDLFQGCKILALHLINPKAVLLEANDQKLAAEKAAKPEDDSDRGAVTDLRVA